MTSRIRNQVVIMAGGFVKCGRCGKKMKTQYGEQDAPCGCFWIWDEATGLLVATASNRFYPGDKVDDRGRSLCEICGSVVDFDGEGWQEADPGVVCRDCMREV